MAIAVFGNWTRLHTKKINKKNFQRPTYPRFFSHITGFFRPNCKFKDRPAFIIVRSTDIEQSSRNIARIYVPKIPSSKVQALLL